MKSSLSILISILILRRGFSTGISSKICHDIDDNDKNDTGIICLCRDRDGLDCDHSLPKAEGLYLYKQYKDKSSEGLYEALQPKCCSMGGGDYIAFESLTDVGDDTSEGSINGSSSSILSVEKDLRMLTERLSNFDEKFGTDYMERLVHSKGGDSLHQAIFWLMYDDEMHILPGSSYLQQRFALAVIYFELGGSLRWKTCWSGKRYAYEFSKNELNDFIWRHPYYNQDKLLNSTECSPELNSGGKSAWLTNTHECDWAFISCNRNKFITKIEMSKYL